MLRVPFSPWLKEKPQGLPTIVKHAHVERPMCSSDKVGWPPRTTPEPIWAEKSKLSAVGEEQPLESAILWMDEIHFAPLGNHGTPLLVGIYRGIESFQGFLGGAGFRPSTVPLSHNEPFKGKVKGTPTPTPQRAKQVFEELESRVLVLSIYKGNPF